MSRHLFNDVAHSSVHCARHLSSCNATLRCA